MSGLQCTSVLIYCLVMHFNENQRATFKLKEKEAKRFYRTLKWMNIAEKCIGSTKCDIITIVHL